LRNRTTITIINASLKAHCRQTIDVDKIKYFDKNWNKIRNDLLCIGVFTAFASNCITYFLSIEALIGKHRDWPWNRPCIIIYYPIHLIANNYGASRNTTIESTFRVYILTHPYTQYIARYIISDSTPISPIIICPTNYSGSSTISIT